MKKTLLVIASILFSLTLTGCGKEEVIEEHDLVKKFNQVAIDMSKEEVKQILTVTDEATGKYEDSKITVTYREDKVSMVSLQLSYNASEISNPKTDLETAQSFTTMLNNGEKFYYQNLVSAFKTEGVCTIKVKDACTQYQWADAEGRYLTATINAASDGHIITVSGRV